MWRLTPGPGLRPTEFISLLEASPANRCPLSRERSQRGQATKEGKPQLPLPRPQPPQLLYSEGLSLETGPNAGPAAQLPRNSQKIR